MAGTAAAKVNSAVYDLLGERWYEATDDPIALLRAEAALRSPWIAMCLKSRHGMQARVLDLGCGAGFLSNALARDGFSVVGVDTSDASLSVARTHDVTHSVHYQRSDATDLPFPDASFDAVCAMDLLEHVFPPETVLKEASRVLRPGGTFFFHTFNRNWLAWLIVIKGVEWFVRNTPKRLHVLHLFIKPSELQVLCRKHGMEVRHMFGMKPIVCNRGFVELLLTGRVTNHFRFRFSRSTRLAYLGFAVRTVASTHPASGLSSQLDTRALDGPSTVPGWLTKVLAWIRLGRPQFLPGGLIAFAFGTSVAANQLGSIDWRRFAFGQLVVTSIQLMTHYANDYFDFDGDRTTPNPARWSGGSGVLSRETLKPSVALASALLCAMLATTATYLTYVYFQGLLVVDLMLAALVLAWAYSAPPFRLHSRGLGELTATVIVAGLVPAIGYAIQADALSLTLVLSMIPLLLVQCAMLLVVSAPDADGDRRCGKLTLLLRLGPRRSRVFHLSLLAVTYAILPFLLAAGLPNGIVFATACTAPLAVLNGWWVLRGALEIPSMWPDLAESSVALVFLCALAGTLGFALDS
ncbi:MAG: bifunctional 2-polyprenyl-6-hydroxyphenol methylase/3-demethylubiquinol 3-O-methyltransferase UbiG [Polyangiaceae bacterium]